ncbi:hypothetical protein J5N97_003907 [Dioscorea zingiberensis]|uniref:Uncharacterized protein n=1 Tax=Dioscorea zingiberensis TaxID=325984 RepID=A0A9D5D550_9LILI|nr:hypothetical protein J5N97_003907 [Dioscorea zingiberensis]
MDPMAATSRDTLNAFTQVDAFLRKNLTFQKRNLKTNIGIIAFPVLLCLLLTILQHIVNHELMKPRNRCGCRCVDVRGDNSCETVCGIEYSTLYQSVTYPFPSPPAWLPLLQVPPAEFHAARVDSTSLLGLLDESCKVAQSCPATVLNTSLNQSLAKIISIFSLLYTGHVRVEGK